jgi:hypothetical protein
MGVLCTETGLLFLFLWISIIQLNHPAGGLHVRNAGLFNLNDKAMQNEFYNQDMIEDSAESYLWRISTHSQAIYISLLAGVAIAFLSMPFICVDVVVPATGIIRSLGERNEVKSVGLISPDSNLIAECYISPKDIGRIRKGMPATFQIDAFDHNVWGRVRGKVSGISEDVILLNDQPIFKITCQLDNISLRWKNSYRRDLKNGMTLKARFSLDRRSLFQLLFDKADDWLNPLQEN